MSQQKYNHRYTEDDMDEYIPTDVDSDDDDDILSITNRNSERIKAMKNLNNFSFKEWKTDKKGNPSITNILISGYANKTVRKMIVPLAIIKLIERYKTNGIPNWILSVTDFFERSNELIWRKYVHNRGGSDLWTPNALEVGPKFNLNGIPFLLTIRGIQEEYKGSKDTVFVLKMYSHLLPLNVSSFDITITVIQNKKEHHIKFHFDGTCIDDYYFKDYIEQSVEGDNAINILDLDKDGSDLYFEVNKFQVLYCDMNIKSDGLYWKLNAYELELLERAITGGVNDNDNPILKEFKDWKFELRMNRRSDELLLIVQSSPPSYIINSFAVKYALMIKYDTDKFMEFNGEKHHLDSWWRGSADHGSVFTIDIPSATFPNIKEFYVSGNIEIIGVQEKSYYRRIESGTVHSTMIRNYRVKTIGYGKYHDIPKEAWSQYGIY